MTTVEQRPSARKTDPRSSHEAAKRMSGKSANSQQKMWLETLNEYLELGNADATRSELAQFAARSRWKKYKSDKRAYAALQKGEIQRGKAQIGRRFPELEYHGLVRVTTIRKCNVTGSAHQAWTINPIAKAAISKN